MSSQTVVIAKELTEILREVLKSADYFTDLGKSVKRGFYAHVLADDSTRYPAAIIHPALEDAYSVRGGGRDAQIRLTIPVVLAARAGTDESGYDELADCAADARRAIFAARKRLTTITNDEALSIGAAEPEMSTDSRYVLIAFNVAVTFTESYH